MQRKAHAFGMASYFNDLKDEENFVKRTGNIPCDFLPV